MANNSIVFNAAFAGVLGGMHNRWIRGVLSSDYTAARASAVTIATAIDAAVPINPLLTEADAAIMQSICQGIFADRFPTADVGALATSIAALFASAISENFPILTTGYETDFLGVVAAAGVLNFPQWATAGTLTAIQRDVGATHSANNPGQLQFQLGAGLIAGCGFIGPWDFSTIAEFGMDVMIPTDVGNELANCAFGWGIVQTPSDFGTAASGRVWNNTSQNLFATVRSTGTGAGFWQLHTSGGTTPGTSTTQVVLDRWYELMCRKVDDSGNWQLYINGVASATRSLVPTSGIAYLAVGGTKNADPAGRNWVTDKIWLKTSALQRFSL